MVPVIYIDILFSSCKRPFVFDHDRFFCITGKPWRTRSLYIAHVDSLPPSPGFTYSDRISLITIGEIPDIYRPHCEYLCASPDTTICALINEVSGIFVFFNDWELRLQQMIHTHAPLRTFGKELYDLVDNPVGFYTNFLQTVFFIDERKMDPSDHYRFPDKVSPSLEELQITYTEKDYKHSLTTRQPSILPATRFGWQALYINLFVEKEFIGRIVIDELYHPAKKSDLSILLLFSKSFKQLYIENENLFIDLPKEMEEMMHTLMTTGSYLPEYDEIIRLLKWDRDDRYICILFQRRANAQKISMKISSIYLQHLFPQCLVYGSSAGIILIINTCSTELGQLMPALEDFCANNMFIAGISNPFDGFHHLKTYYLQACDAIKIGTETEHSKCIYHFKDHVLDKMFAICREEYPVEYFISPEFLRLVDHDKKNHTEFCKTLDISLQCNMNHSQALKRLSLSRTAYLYRMKRIREITGYDLNDFKTRLYLMDLFQLIGCHNVEI